MSAPGPDAGVRPKRWHGGQSAAQRRPGDRATVCPPEAVARWEAFFDAAIRLAGRPEDDIAELIGFRDELRRLVRPGHGLLAHRAINVFLDQVDLYVMVPRAARVEFANLTHDTAVQARRIAIGALPASLRHPSLGKD